jgi:hypothetical protein
MGIGLGDSPTRWIEHVTYLGDAVIFVPNRMYRKFMCIDDIQCLPITQPHRGSQDLVNVRIVARSCDCTRERTSKSKLKPTSRSIPRRLFCSAVHFAHCISLNHPQPSPMVKNGRKGRGYAESLQYPKAVRTNRQCCSIDVKSEDSVLTPYRWCEQLDSHCQ